MKIKEISIKNFRQYMDVTLSFPETPFCDLNYILAENGIGKTTLLNAITWCLYGEELHITDTLKDKSLPMFTLKKLREMNGGEENETSVKITIEDGYGEISFCRYAIYRKTEEGNAYLKRTDQKVILKPLKGTSDVLKEENDFIIEVNKRLPSKIKQFFFFDGEQLDTYLDSAAGENIEKSVAIISQINLLESMEKNLNSMANDLKRKSSKGNSKSEELQEKIEKKKEEIENLNKEYNKCLDELKRVDERLKKLNQDLKNEPDLEKIEKDRDKLKEILKNLYRNQIKNTNDIKEFSKKYFILLSSMPRLKEMYDLIKEKENKGELPPKYDPDELAEMVNHHHCFVCDRDLDTDSTIFILNLLKRYELGQETGTLLTRLIGTLQMQIKEAPRYEKEKENLYGIRDRIKQDIEENEKNCKILNDKLDLYTNKEAIKLRYRQREELEAYKEEIYSKPAKKEAELGLAKANLEELETKLEDALAKDEKNKKLYEKACLTKNAKNKVTEIISKIKGEIREQISEEMSDKFFELMWKKKFQSVKITENYVASVINNDGFECLGSCSAAERELLVLAFTLALHQESGFDGPLVIDTPISRISGDLRASFAKVLCSVSKNKQIILFVTEDEYSTNVRDVFEINANKKYRLSLIDEDYVQVGEI